MMKEPTLIICPHCGKQTATENVCRHCGKDIGTPQGLEVQYRDFKGSEMLDIKMSPPSRKEGEKPGSRVPDHAESSRPSKNKSAAGKAFLFIGATLAIIVAALGWYYLLKFFLKF